MMPLQDIPAPSLRGFDRPLTPVAAAISSTPPAAWRSAEANEDRKMRGRRPETPELRRKQTEIVKTIGQRLKASRELCNLSLSEAARRLGYANPSKLSKVENATDTNSVPLWLIRDAAEFYEVSTEYLFGLSEDWETGTHRGVTHFLLAEWDRLRNRDFRAIVELDRHIKAVSAVIPAMRRDAQAVLDATNRISELNGADFEELRGGSVLTAAADRLRKTAGDALEAERRLHLVLAEPATTESTEG